MMTIEEYTHNKIRLTENQTKIIHEQSLDCKAVWAYMYDKDTDCHNGIIEEFDVVWHYRNCAPTVSKLYTLNLGNEEWCSYSLRELEDRLYEWAKDEGIFDTKSQIEARRREIALENAKQAFWSSIAASYPDAVGGDLSPDATMWFDKYTESAVKEWVHNNVNDEF